MSEQLASELERAIERTKEWLPLYEKHPELTSLAGPPIVILRLETAESLLVELGKHHASR